jgi:hypothetical protein
MYINKSRNKKEMSKKETNVAEPSKIKAVKEKKEVTDDVFKPTKTKKIRRNKNKTDAPKPPFSIYYPHNNKNPTKYINEEGKEEIICLVIDPGSVNCGFFFFSYIPKDDMINPLSVKRLEFREKGITEENMHFTESIKIFDTLSVYIEKCHYIIIESQIGFAYNNIRISQHFISYFMTRYRNIGNMPLVIELNSKDKIRLLGCTDKKKIDYKKWSEGKALELLNNDKQFLKNEECMNSYIEKGKKDDKADSICLGYVFKKYLKDNISGEGFFKINLPQ